MNGLVSSLAIVAVAVSATLFFTYTPPQAASTSSSSKAAQAGAATCDAAGGATQWDYIVVGGGTTGCVVAGRLAAARPSWNVLVLERGEDVIREPYVQPPSWNAVFAPVLSNPVGFPVEAHAVTVPIKAAGFVTEYVPRVMGGGPQISGSFWGRGDPSNYDDWAAELDDPTWRYDALQPLFARSENFVYGFNPDTPVDPSRGRSGPILVSALNTSDARIGPFAASLASHLGVPRVTDYNTASRGTQGVAPLQRTFGHDASGLPIRSSTYSAYLRPLMDDGRHPNLSVRTHAHVTRINFDRSSGTPRAVSVDFVVDGVSHTACVRAGGEVVVSAGAYNNPKLLHLSGVGPAEKLRPFGIPVVRDLPGVGANLQDHLAVPFRFALNATLFPTGRDPKDNGYPPHKPATSDLLRPYPAPASVLAEDSTPMIAFYASAHNKAAAAAAGAGAKPKPDMEVLFAVSDCSNSVCLAGSFLALHNEARGAVELSSSDPFAPPVIGLNWHSTAAVQTDQRRFGEALTKLRAAFVDAMPGVVTAEMLPGTGVAPRNLTDANVAAALSAFMFGYHHPAGTCKMGRRDDPLAVVDAQLRVFGLANVRVADNSVMPRLVTAHPSGTSTVIGERLADLILAERK